MRRGHLWVCALALSVFCIGSGAFGKTSRCRLSAQDKQANAVLDFKHFDQMGSSPATARQLADKACYQEAADATADYLVRASIKSADEQRDLLFHLAQYRAEFGDETGAAFLAAAAKDPNQKPGDELDWNAYVEGTWAFLAKDEALLTQMHDKLASENSTENRINARVLAGLLHCFRKPYRQAYGGACMPKDQQPSQ